MSRVRGFTACQALAGGVRRRRVTLFWVLVVVLWPALARADAVDDAFARGNDAAAQQDWKAAVEAYEQARTLLPEPSAVLSYNLGTVYLHLDDLGRASFHLRQALDWQGGPTAELVESARYNLAVARRRADLAATTAGTKIDRPETWWDLVLEALRAPGLGWVTLVCGWLLLLVLWIHRRRRREGRGSTTVTGTILAVLITGFVGLGVLHGLALRADRTSPEAIILPVRADAREGPGMHRRVEFSLQGGARVRIVERTPGWRRIRLPGGLEGWVPEGEVGELRRRAGASVVVPAPTSRSAS